LDLEPFLCIVAAFWGWNLQLARICLQHVQAEISSLQKPQTLKAKRGIGLEAEKGL
jgi:hypothetical protein